VKLNSVPLDFVATGAGMSGFLAITASLWCFLAGLNSRPLATLVTGGVFLPRLLEFWATSLVVPVFVTITTPYGAVPTHLCLSFVGVIL